MFRGIRKLGIKRLVSSALRVVPCGFLPIRGGGGLKTFSRKFLVPSSERFSWSYKLENGVAKFLSPIIFLHSNSLCLVSCFKF